MPGTWNEKATVWWERMARWILTVWIGLSIVRAFPIGSSREVAMPMLWGYLYSILIINTLFIYMIRINGIYLAKQCAPSVMAASVYRIGSDWHFIFYVLIV